MSFVETASEDFTGSAGAITNMTPSAGSSDWQRDGAGNAIGGDAFNSAVAHDTQAGDDRMAVQIALPGTLSNRVLIHVNSPPSAWDEVFLAVGPELYYNGAYQGGYWGGGTADESLRIEDDGAGDYEIFVDGVSRASGLTPTQTPGAGQNYGGMRGNNGDDFPSLLIEEWSSGGGTDDLTPLESVVTVVNDTGSITQTHSLTPGESVVLVVNDQGSVTQTHGLSPGESIIQIVNDGTTITAGQTLTPLESVVQVVNDPTTVSQTHVLTPGESVVVIVNDPTTLSQGVGLVPGESIIQIVNDTGAVTQTHLLTVGESVVVVVNDPATVVAEGDATIQMQATPLAPRWSAGPLRPRYLPSELTSRWAAGPLRN